MRMKVTTHVLLALGKLDQGQNWTREIRLSGNVGKACGNVNYGSRIEADWETRGLATRALRLRAPQFSPDQVTLHLTNTLYSRVLFRFLGPSEVIYYEKGTELIKFKKARNL